MADRGEVWWGPAPFKDSSVYRPWLVVSTDAHPFAGEECIAVALTTSRHREGVPFPEEAWSDGRANLDSFVSPWYVATLKSKSLDRRQGALPRDLVSEVVEQFHEYVPVTAGN